MYKVAIITISDSCFLGQRQDKSGDIIAQIATQNKLKVWEKLTLPDDYDKIKNALISLSDKGANLVLTTGGTGFSKRDITPEATKAVIEKEAPGITQAIRANGAKFTSRSMLSRAVCGIRGDTIILNLPGSPKAVEEDLEFALPSLIHALDILLGNASNCARK